MAINNCLNSQPIAIYNKKAMDYLKHYDKLVSRAKARILESGVYRERHHIIPRSEGGLDEDANLVYLTAREHFIAHWLLYRANPHIPSRAYSFWRMCNGKGKVSTEDWIVIPSRAYEEGKLAFSRTISKTLTGKPKSPEHIAKVAAANTGQKRDASARRNMSNAAKSRELSVGFFKMLEAREAQNKKQMKPVAMLDPNTKEKLKVFDSMKDAALFINRDTANITAAIKNSRKCAGYFWENL